MREWIPGEIIFAESLLKLEEGDTPEILQKSVMEEAEWKLLPAAINMIANQKIRILER